MSRKPVLAANWKMNLMRADATTFCRALREGSSGEGVEILLFPPATLIGTVYRALKGYPAVCGGQDVHPQSSGAFTGDLSAAHLRDAGCDWVLCGHSERRRDHGETDEIVGRKARTAWAHKLRPLICLGETVEERRQGQTLEVLARQLRIALNGGQETPLDSFEIAYEPVWAIGTGETATPEMAQEAHAFLRQQLVEQVGEDLAQRVRILYGGSAKPENVDALIAQQDIDGFLVGGASLDSKKFLAMISSCAGLA